MKNILRDVVFKIEGGGLDDGAFTASGSPVTVLLNSAEFSIAPATSDHRNGQQLISKNRVDKKDMTIRVNTMLKHANLRSDIATVGSAGAVLTLYPGGVDDLIFGTGGALNPDGTVASPGTAGTGLTSLCFDGMTFTQTNEVVDHSCTNEEYTKHRIKGRGQTFTFETKMQDAGASGVENLLKTNELIGFYVPIKPGGLATAQVLLGGHGIVESVEFGYNGPNTVRFTLGPYGSGIGVTLGTGDTASIESLFLPASGSASVAGSTTGFGSANELFRFSTEYAGVGEMDVTAVGVVETITIGINQGPLTLDAVLRSYGIAPTLTLST